LKTTKPVSRSGAAALLRKKAGDHCDRRQWW